MSALDTALSKLIDQANSKSNTAVVTRLPDGMRIEAFVDGRVIKISVRRQTKYPTFDEWRSVLDHIPWPVRIITPERGPNNTLSGLFVIHPKLF